MISTLSQVGLVIIGGVVLLAVITFVISSLRKTANNLLYGGIDRDHNIPIKPLRDDKGRFVSTKNKS